VHIDDVAIDVIPDCAPPESWGARAMQSRWLARVYQAWWRPLAFGWTTRFTAPGASEEARLVLDRMAATPGPWLDLSCGPGILTRELLVRGGGRKVFAVDRSRAMLERARAAAPGAILVRADAAALPFADGVFGAVVNLAALDLYPEPAQVIAEAARVLVRGGRWICSTFVESSARKPSVSLARLSGARAPTLDELAAAATRAGLDRLGNLRFQRYVIAWADKA
jgi:SAM-dependent methyltransferase